MRSRAIIETVIELFLPQSPRERRLLALTAEEIAAHLAPTQLPESKTHVLFSYRRQDIKHLIWLLKYRGNKRVAALFAECIYNYLLEELADTLLFETDSMPVLIPMPRDTHRIKKFGCDQTKLIARALALLDKEKSFTVRDDVLKRVKSTPSQTKATSREMRHANLVGAFAVRDCVAVSDASIVLIDDVITTGATMNEAHKTLLDAGAKHVLCLAIAH